MSVSVRLFVGLPGSPLALQTHIKRLRARRLQSRLDFSSGSSARYVVYGFSDFMDDFV